MRPSLFRQRSAVVSSRAALESSVLPDESSVREFFFSLTGKVQAPGPELFSFPYYDEAL